MKSIKVENGVITNVAIGKVEEPDWYYFENFYGLDLEIGKAVAFDKKGNIKPPVPENKDERTYVEMRKEQYDIEVQLDMLYESMKSGEIPKSKRFVEYIDNIKFNNPKPPKSTD